MAKKDQNLGYAAEVIADNSGEFCGNALRFPTKDEAETYAKDLFSRWTAVKEYRIVQFVPKGLGVSKVVVS